MSWSYRTLYCWGDKAGIFFPTGDICKHFFPSGDIGKHLLSQWRYLQASLFQVETKQASFFPTGDICKFAKQISWSHWTLSCRLEIYASKHLLPSWDICRAHTGHNGRWGHLMIKAIFALRPNTQIDSDNSEVLMPPFSLCSESIFCWAFGKCPLFYSTAG